MDRCKSSTSIPDLSDIEGKDLRKRHLNEILNRECHGVLYTGTFRKLQLRKDQYQSFYETSLCHFRKKDLVIDHLQRGKERDFNALSDLFIRGYGGLHWGKNRGWVIDEEQLAEGEEMLHYIRPKDRQAGDNEWFHPILVPLWQQMRNATFELKTTSWPSERKKSGSRSNGRAGSSKYPDDSRLLRSEPKVLSAEQTEEAIINLAVDLQKIKMFSEQTIFEKLWEQHICRLDEGFRISDSHATNDTLKENASSPVLYVDTFQNQANEPFASQGNPMASTTRSDLCPIMPEIMSVYISYRNQKTYHWPDAPVTPGAQELFIDGLLLRANVETNLLKNHQHVHIVLSYGWNDACRTITAHCPGERVKSSNVGHCDEAWRGFINDLQDAAKKGVRVWRMKVCILLGSR